MEKLFKSVIVVGRLLFSAFITLIALNALTQDFIPVTINTWACVAWLQIALLGWRDDNGRV